jgi:hypothetical protein
MEGSQFVNCEICDTDMGSLNVEFISLSHTKLNRVVFPFYQFPYVIGAADYIRDPTTTVSFRAGGRQIFMSEYREQLSNLIIYYWDKEQYFAMCNLYIAQDNIIAARECLLEGINTALDVWDFRMIRHFCRLAKYHGILNEELIQNILKKIDEFILGADIPDKLLNDFLIHTGEIRVLLLSGNRDSVTYHLNIRTNVSKEEEAGVIYVNSLVNDLNGFLSQNTVRQMGFQVTASSHSPIEIILEIVSTVGDLASLAMIIQSIWNIITTHRSKPQQPIENIGDIDICSPIDDLENHIEQADRNELLRCIEWYKEQMKNICLEYSGKDMNPYIAEIFQKLQTDVIELYDKDIMIFRKINDLRKNK